MANEATMSAVAPAKAWGLYGTKGVIAVGAHADIAFVDMVVQMARRQAGRAIGSSRRRHCTLDRDAVAVQPRTVGQRIATGDAAARRFRRPAASGQTQLKGQELAGLVRRQGTAVDRLGREKICDVRLSEAVVPPGCRDCGLQLPGCYPPADGRCGDLILVSDLRSFDKRDFGHGVMST